MQASAGSGAVIDAHGLSKSFRGKIAVDGVDLRVGAGRIQGLLGPNGAGKTTVLAMLFGLVPPDAGDLRLFGRAAGAAGALDRVAGFVETPRFYPYLDARSNLRGLAALDGRVRPSKIDDVLGAVQMAGHDGEKVRDFSLGMRQRLGLAAALLREPELLIVDEPANGLDPAGMRDLRLLLRQLAEGGMSILLSSHDMPQVEDLCDEVTVMRSGSVVFEGTMAAMREQAPDPSYRLRTSDDDAALGVAAARSLTAAHHDDGGLAVHGKQSDLDAYVIALGAAGVAVRMINLAVTPLESLFFRLTEGAPGPPAPPADVEPVSVVVDASAARP